jgi:hypothetical protein
MSEKQAAFPSLSKVEKQECSFLQKRRLLSSFQKRRLTAWAADPAFGRVQPGRRVHATGGEAV